MTDAEKALLELVMHPDFEHALQARNGPHCAPVLAARQRVARERVPPGFEEELLRLNDEAAKAASKVRAFGASHPLVAFGHEGLLAKKGQQ
jgi:hypothetical protein